MRPIDEMTAERAAEACAGLHYTSTEFKSASAAVEWEGLWPEINRDGILTGRTVGDEDGYLNVADEAMIAVAEARLGRWTIDREGGRASPPEPRYEYTIGRDGVTTTPAGPGRRNERSGR